MRQGPALGRRVERGILRVERGIGRGLRRLRLCIGDVIGFLLRGQIFLRGDQILLILRQLGLFVFGQRVETLKTLDIGIQIIDPALRRIQTFLRLRSLRCCIAP